MRSSHSQLSSDPHPLLSEELLRIKAPLQREAAPLRNSLQIPVKEEEQNPDVVDAFGSLSITLSGRAKYFGQTANSWVCSITFFCTRLDPNIHNLVLSPGLLFSSLPLQLIMTVEWYRTSYPRRMSRKISLLAFEASYLPKY